MRMIALKKTTKPQTPAQPVFLEDFSSHAVTGNLQAYFTALQHLLHACPPPWGTAGVRAVGDSGTPQQPPHNALQTPLLRLCLRLRSG